MLDIVLVAIVAISAVWVYWDATNNKIGKVPNAESANIAAGTWGILTLILWIIIFPVYLLKRKSLIERAIESPVEVSDGKRKARTFFIGMAGVALVALAFLESKASSLPGCADAEVKNLVGQIANGMSSMIAAEAKFVSVKDISELGYNEQDELRSCSATMVSTVGEDSIQYSIEWKDKDKWLYYVTVRPQ